MEAIDLLKSRRSVLVKNLTSPGPDKEDLQQILEVGLVSQITVKLDRGEFK